MFKDVTDFVATPVAERHGAARDPSRPPPGAATDWTVPQRWADFGAEDHAVWDLLFARQQTALDGRAVAAFGEGLEMLRLSRPGIPEFGELNARLQARTGWTVVAVPGLVPDDIFFEHLRHRRFPAGNFIRRRDQLDYLEEPDVFHDVFGHVPLLALPEMADFMQLLGELGLAAMQAGALHRLGRLYWYTVEFGLAEEAGRRAIYGAGIVSSFGESRYALDDPRPRRTAFDLETVLRTAYRSDAFQQGYFTIPHVAALIDQVSRAELPELYAALADLPDLDPATGEPIGAEDGGR
ncbi:phenylalanine 4-monooxygenase [Allosphingosinicella indica]|uniref:Phenylalanine-4-hydroxylase n=1 Tax=Allosphingosinicella indica TaxID=941907 RepID=A0A1X7G6H2_9SPHN|nr:phenylalanine 4-monooxygenase [Allosphingosinicella indica]SMF64025.1 Phenylalanine 4-hydroxylase [Allosphingosinicella indica]